MMGLIKLILNRLPVRLIRSQSIRYDEDGLTTINSAPFLCDKVFQSVYAAGAATGSWGHASIRWRAHVILWAIESVKALPGDFAECGVNRGGLSRAIVEHPSWAAANRRFYLLDTFQGFDPRFLPEDIDHWRYPDVYAEVVSTFSKFPGVEIVRGAVPDTLNEVKSNQFAFVHIDMNAAVPEVAALEFFWPKIVSGGILILDDYGFPGHQEQLDAHNAFASRNDFSILSLPTGQGFAIKR